MMTTINQREEDVVMPIWVQMLCESDRMIVGQKHHEVQDLIKKIIMEPIPDANQSLALVPVFPSKKKGPLKKSDKKSVDTPVFNLDWENWTSMDHFYQQLAMTIGLPQTIHTNTSTSKAQENSIVLRQDSSQRFDIKSIRTVMEKELQELGVARLQKMECATCHGFFPTDRLFLITLPSPYRSQRSTVSRCAGCWVGPHSSRSIFDLLVTGIAEKWAKLVGKRVECLYGNWDERLTPMVKMLKDNVLLAEDIAALLTTCVDPEEFKESCEMIIMTTIVFYLEYVDFRRSCEVLIKMKPTVTHSQLFNIFAIYFPNRAKGIKTGDFL